MTVAQLKCKKADPCQKLNSSLIQISMKWLSRKRYQALKGRKKACPHCIWSNGLHCSLPRPSCKILAMSWLCGHRLEVRWQRVMERPEICHLYWNSLTPVLLLKFKSHGPQGKTKALLLQLDLGCAFHEADTCFQSILSLRNSFVGCHICTQSQRVFLKEPKRLFVVVHFDF